jgi:hypothetical protein
MKIGVKVATVLTQMRQYSIISFSARLPQAFHFFPRLPKVVSEQPSTT